MDGPSLIILAAGIGSRFGGLKQTAPVDNKGHSIIDYSLFDAYAAGFRNVVFIINHGIADDFYDAVGRRAEQRFDVSYAFQELDMLPLGFTVPDGRSKPWGTAHAILCAKDAIGGRSFAVINADDYYGRDAIRSVFVFLSQPAGPDEHCMVGYLLKNTCSPAGFVSRGICQAEGGYLKGIVERTQIVMRGREVAYTEDGSSYVQLDPDAIVSMNLWGFRQGLFEQLESRFPEFLENSLSLDPLGCEYFLPSVVNMALEQKKAKISVLTTDEKWYGITYADDLVSVREAIKQMRNQCRYPEKLWDR